MPEVAPHARRSCRRASTLPTPADFVTLIELRNADTRRVRGDDEHTLRAGRAERSRTGRTRPTGASRHTSARVDGEVVGILRRRVRPRGGRDRRGMNMRVREDRWGAGHRVASSCPSSRRASATKGGSPSRGWTEHPESPGERIACGDGRRERARPTTSPRFLVRHGFALEQAFRNSRLDLPARSTSSPMLSRPRSDGGRRRLSQVSWEMPTPAAVHRGLRVDEVADVDGRAERASSTSTEESLGCRPGAAPRRQGCAAAASRRFVGCRAARADRGGSWRSPSSTCVPAALRRPPGRHARGLEEHRGHRSACSSRARLLLRLARARFPDITTVETFNAEENRHMLAINEAMGFAPVLYAGEWQKRADADDQSRQRAAPAGSAGRSGSSGS